MGMIRGGKRRERGYKRLLSNEGEQDPTLRMREGRTL